MSIINDWYPQQTIPHIAFQEFFSTFSGLVLWSAGAVGRRPWGSGQPSLQCQVRSSRRLQPFPPWSLSIGAAKVWEQAEQCGSVRPPAWRRSALWEKALRKGDDALLQVHCPHSSPGRRMATRNWIDLRDHGTSLSWNCPHLRLLQSFRSTQFPNPKAHL